MRTRMRTNDQRMADAAKEVWLYNVDIDGTTVLDGPPAWQVDQQRTNYAALCLRSRGYTPFTR